MTHKLKRKPAKKPWIDKALSIMAFVGPTLSLSQVFQIFATKSAADLSLSSWLGYQVLAILWLIYGITHKEKLIVYYQTAWIVVQSVIILGIILYGDVSTLWNFGIHS